MRVNVGGKAILASFLKIEGRGALVGAKDWRERNRYKNWSEPRSCSTSQEQERAREEGQKRCQERSDCHMSDGEGWVCQGH